MADTTASGAASRAHAPHINAQHAHALLSDLRALLDAIERLSDQTGPVPGLLNIAGNLIAECGDTIDALDAATDTVAA